MKNSLKALLVLLFASSLAITSCGKKKGCEPGCQKECCADKNSMSEEPMATDSATDAAPKKKSNM